jgi:hypothetical protein
MNLPLCEHIKLGGGRCGSPALRDQKYCHYHAATHRAIPNMNVFLKLWDCDPQQEPYGKYQFPYLEDFEAIQIGFTQFIHAVSQGLLNAKEGALILGALQGASRNLRHAENLMAKAARDAPGKKPPASVASAGARSQSLVGSGTP